MSVTEVPGREGWFDVVVYDRVSAPNKRPAKVAKRVKGQRAAERVERELLRDRDRGSLVERRGTLAAYADRYLASRRAEVAKATLNGYQGTVDRYVKRHAIGDMRLSDIDATAVAAFYADLLERGSVGSPVATATVRKVHRILSMILKRAVVDGLVNVNPCTVVKVPKANEAADDNERGVDPAIASEYVATVRDHGMPTGPVAAVALGTGLRLSELLALRWADIDLDASELHVTGKIEQVPGSLRRTATKTTRSTRTVPFGPAVAAVLAAQKRRIAALRLAAPEGTWIDEGWVFPRRSLRVERDGTVNPAGAVWSPHSFLHEWRRDRRLANEIRLAEYAEAGGSVEDFTPPYDFGIHALRHAYGTAQLAAGVRVEVVSRRLGHASSLITLSVYSHVMTTEVRDGVDVADSLL